MPRSALRAIPAIALTTSLLFATTVEAKKYFLSPRGSDIADGSRSSPWRTLEHAFNQLAPGDTLFLRGGVYYEHEVEILVQGTASAPITVRPFRRERVIIDGGIAEFMESPGAVWEVVDPDLALYRSTLTVDGPNVRAWLVDSDRQLVEYESERNLESTHYGPVNGTEPIYIGPGIQRKSDGTLHVRLAPNPNDATGADGRALPPPVDDVDPNAHRLAVSTSRYLFKLDGASFVRFSDLTFSSSNIIFDVRDGSHHITLDRVAMNYGRYGIVLRGDNRGWVIRDSRFSNGLPDYVHWTDVKNRPEEVTEAYPEFQSTAVTGTMTEFTIYQNEFRNTFDGLQINEGTRDASVLRNVFVDILDDSINLSKGIDNVEVACNIMLRSASGIANLGSSLPAGPVYVHHNIIDNSWPKRGGRPGNYREDDWPAWTSLDPFGRHGGGDKRAWWRIYNNTIVSRSGGYGYSPAGPATVDGNPEKYVYNNIFYMLDDRVIFRGDDETNGAHYDGNVFYRLQPAGRHMFLDFGDGRDYDSLDELRLSGTSWEELGMEHDPVFDLASIEKASESGKSTWKRYRPKNRALRRRGASYQGLSWPGARRINYRGAVARNGWCRGIAKLKRAR